jgi:DNA primase
MDQVNQIRERIDIVSYLSELITVKKAGRNFKANCPFHNEKTPSFMISPERQVWHCFGCGKGGDIYTFLMEYERIEFPEALRVLAKRAGVELSRSPGETQTTSRKEVIYKINALAAEFYHYLLLKHNAGKKALAYLSSRNVEGPLLETFKIGFAPHMSYALTNYLTKKKQIPPKDLIEAGLAVSRGGTIADFFTGRIMFPLIDHRDNIIGFSGRAVDEQTFGPKYLNTRETLVYHKGETFFGLNIAKEAMKRTNQVVLVEGEFDVISCFKEGISNTIAIKGTALTEYQATLLARFVQKVTICFDGDAAGQEAIKRSLAVLEKKKLTMTVIEIPNGKDPDESIKKDPYAFKKAFKEDRNIYDYLLERSLTVFDPKTPEGKKQIGLELLPIITRIENEIVKEFYLKKLSASLDTTYESIQKELTRIAKAEVTAKQITAAPKVKRSREEILEEYLLALILQSPTPKESMEKAVNVLAVSISRERAYQKLLHHLLDYLTKHEEFDTLRFGEHLPKELLDAYNRSFLFPLTPFGEAEAYLKEITKVATELKQLYIRQRMKELADEIKDRDAEGEEAEDLRKDYSTLLAQLEK